MCIITYFSFCGMRRRKQDAVALRSIVYSRLLNIIQMKHTLLTAILFRDVQHLLQLLRQCGDGAGCRGPSQHHLQPLAAPRQLGASSRLLGLDALR